MKLLSLRLRGAIGIREGLGLEEINIDFRQFSAGMITVMGENGAGKTTFIENLTPFRLLRSRQGGLARQFFLKDSCRDLLIDMNGDEYRFLIEMNPTLKTPAIKSYVYKNGECLNPDGNEEGYSAIVTKLFGDPDLFFSSLFMTQKRVPFSKIDAAKRKDLLLELIGAGHLQAKCEFANQSAKGLREEIAGVVGEIYALGNSTRPVEAILADIALLQKMLDGNREKIAELDAQIATAKSDLELYQTKQTEQAVVQSQLAQARQRLASLNGELATVQASFDQKARQLRIFIDGDQSEMEKLAGQYGPEDEAKIDGLILTAEKAKVDYLATVESRKEYDQLVLDYSHASYKFDMAKRGHESELQLLKSHVANALHTFEEKKTRVDFKRKELTDEIARKTKSTQILQTVPCQDDTIPIDCRDACKSCQFLKDATAAVQELGHLSQKLVDGEEAWTVISAGLTGDVATAQAAVNENPSWASEAAPLQAAIDTAKASIDALGFDATAAENSKRKYDEWERADYPGQKRKMQEAGTKLDALTLKVSENQDRLIELRAEIGVTMAGINEQINTVTAERDLLPKIDITIESRISNLRNDLRIFELDKQNQSESAARNETNIARLIEDKNRAELSAIETQRAKTKLTELQTDLADWEHLAQALSRTGGFQSMLVESAGAEMTPFANELLVLYGRPWTIEISTCKPSADGKKLVDGFYVTVNTPNGPRELSDLSGGEEVIVDQVIYDAIANMLRRRSGLLLQTAIKDECDGSLDGDRAIDYIKAVEAAHYVSGMHHTLLISHRESIQDLIPNRLRFIKGQGIAVEAA